jgi:hypothetical protein
MAFQNVFQLLAFFLLLQVSEWVPTIYTKSQLMNVFFSLGRWVAKLERWVAMSREMGG